MFSNSLVQDAKQNVADYYFFLFLSEGNIVFEQICQFWLSDGLYDLGVIDDRKQISIKCLSESLWVYVSVCDINFLSCMPHELYTKFYRKLYLVSHQNK